MIAWYMQKHPDLKGVFGTSDEAVQLAVRALDQAGLNSGDSDNSENSEASEGTSEGSEDIRVMGFDAGPDQIASLENGEIDGLIVQNPFGMGYAAVVAAARTVLEAGNEAVVNTGYVWVDSENMEDEAVQPFLYN